MADKDAMDRRKKFQQELDRVKKKQAAGSTSMMTPEQFVYWLNGFFELECPETLTKVQIEKIRDHLNLVLNKVTPVRDPKEVLDSLKIRTSPHPVRIC